MGKVDPSYYISGDLAGGADEIKFKLKLGIGGRPGVWD